MRREFRPVLARIVRSAIGGLQARSIQAPDLSRQGFVDFLAKRGLMASTQWDSKDAATLITSGHDIAYKLRRIIGDRFFLPTSEVDPAIARLDQLMPAWTSELESFVDDCRWNGLPIYSMAGATLEDESFWRSIPPGPGNDLLFPFRPHRFAFLPRLTLAVHKGLLDAGVVRRIVDAWVAQAVSGNCPFSYGSNLVVIQRLLATSWAWLFLAARPPAHTEDGLGLEETLLRILWADTQFLGSRLGDSVPNNHLLADRFIAFFISSVFPEFGINRVEVAEREFRDEFLRQTYADGGSFEHSTHYHEFACEMGAAYLLICRRAGRAPVRELQRRVEALLIFHMRITGAGAMPLLVGNATEDSLFPLDSIGGWCAGSLREIYRGLFALDYAPAPTSDGSRERAFWLLGGRIDSRRDEICRDWLPASMPDAGFHVFPDHKAGGRLIFRSGPGETTAVVAGHMHADLMSIYLDQRDRPLLVDAGTLTYRWACRSSNEESPRWRSYFSSPSAHNTLSIAGLDPLGDLEGDFRRFETSVRVASHSCFGNGITWVEARVENAGPYSGYVRGCVHLEGRYWIVYDEIPERHGTTRERWLGFQFAPEVRLDITAGRVTASFEDGDAAVTLASTFEELPQLLEGSLDPLGGWVSMRYGEVSRAPQLRYPVGARKHRSAFVISDARSAPESLEIQPLGSGLLGIRIETSAGHDWLAIRSQLTLSPTGETSDLNFDGSALWLEFNQLGLEAARWIDGGVAIWPSKNVDLALKGVGSTPL